MWDRRRETGDIRQEIWDKRRETGDLRQETWDMRKGDVRQETGDTMLMLQKVLQVSGIRTRDSAAADRCATNELNSPIKYGQDFLVNTAQWRTFWMARIYFPICGEVALKLSGKVVRWRENFRWNNVVVVRWRKDLKSGARRGGASLKSGARPALI